VRSNQLFTLSVPNSISILWLLPQYLAISVGEVMFAVTGLEFSYSQAPPSLKSVVQAAWLLTTAMGNAIIIPGTPQLLPQRFALQSFSHSLICSLALPEV
jgi:dipeptide/tripeptide permease